MSRHAKTFCGSSEPGSIAPSVRCVAAKSSGARTIVFVGMQAQYEHSPPTRRRSTSGETRLLVEPAEGADEVLAGRPSTENDNVPGARAMRARSP